MLTDAAHDSHDNNIMSSELPDFTLSPLTDDDTITRSPRGQDNGPYFDDLGSPLSDPTHDGGEFQEELDFFSNYFDYNGDDTLLMGSPDGQLEYIPPDTSAGPSQGEFHLGSSSQKKEKSSKSKKSKKEKSSKRKSKKKSVKSESQDPSSPGSVFSVPAGEKILYVQRPWMLVLNTEFHHKYWRNDRKNLQCFPLCPEHGDYYRVRMEELKHSQSGTCKSPIYGSLIGPTSVVPEQIISFARVSFVDPVTKEPMWTEGELPQIGKTLSQREVDALRSNAFPGRLFPVHQSKSTSKKIHGQEFKVNFSGDNWKVNMELSKKRRPANDRNKVPLYCVETLVFHMINDKDQQYALVFRGMSSVFEIASTRTLLRDVQRAQEEGKLPSRKKKSAPLDLELVYDEIMEGTANHEDVVRKSRKKHRMKGHKAVGHGEPDGGSLDENTSDEDSSGEESSDESIRTTASAPVASSSRMVPMGDSQSNLASTATIDTSAMDVLRKPESPSAPLLDNEARAEISVRMQDDHKYPSAPELGNLGDASSQVEPNSGSSRNPSTERNSAQHEHVIEVGEPSTTAHVSTRRMIIGNKSKLEGYGWWLPPTGVFGAHHFYLDRPVWGVVYLCTFGLFTLGWLLDLFRMPYLVKARNDGSLPVSTLGEVRLVGLLGGFLGMHRFAMGQWKWGLYYLFTLGSLGTGYIADQFRMGTLYEQMKKDDELRRLHRTRDGPALVNTADAYVLSIPLGLLGAHHYYLGRYGHGILYTCTFGVLGLGLLRDLFIMPQLVTDANREIQMDFEYRQHQGVELNTIVLARPVYEPGHATAVQTGSPSQSKRKRRVHVKFDLDLGSSRRRRGKGGARSETGSTKSSLDREVELVEQEVEKQVAMDLAKKHEHAAREIAQQTQKMEAMSKRRAAKLQRKLDHKAKRLEQRLKKEAEVRKRRERHRRQRDGPRRSRSESPVRSNEPELVEATEAIRKVGHYLRGQWGMFKQELMAELNPSDAPRRQVRRGGPNPESPAIPPIPPMPSAPTAPPAPGGVARMGHGSEDGDENVPMAEVV